MMIEKGYPIESGYMGLINEKYMLFESERYVCSLINKREEGKQRAAKKLQTLYLELSPFIELYKNIPSTERQTIKIIVKEEDTYSKSPYIYYSATSQKPVLYTRENGHNKTLTENITMTDHDYNSLCMMSSIVQDMEIQKIKEDFKKAILNAIKRATESKQNKMVKIIDALSAFYSDDKTTTLQKQLEELFKLKDEYKTTNNEFCLCLVLNQIEKIQTMMKNN